MAEDKKRKHETAGRSLGRRQVVKGMLATALLSHFSVPTAAATTAAADIDDRVDWEAFLKRHDLLWARTPRRWEEGAFLGNGLVGTMIWANPGDEALHFDVGRSDVIDKGNRLAIGRFELTTAGKVADTSNLRLDLWNAEARGDLPTASGGIAFRAFTHADHPVTLIEWEPRGGEASGTATAIQFRHEPAVDARKTYRKEPLTPEDQSPDPTFGEKDGIHWCVQPFRAGGGYVVAWGEKQGDNGKRLFAWSVDAVPASKKPDANGAASTAVREALAGGSAAAEKSHRDWWHAFWQQSFLSIPDTRMESFYWIQMYKFASGTRADRPALDLMGPWFRNTPWPRIWWNLNIQLTYWPVYASNRLSLGESLTRMLDAGMPNLIRNVPAEFQADSAGISRTSSYDCVSKAGREIGDLTWATHNYWLQYRHSGDEKMLRDRLYPLLSRATMYMVHRLEPGADGKLHFPVDISPEYPHEAPDTNYNHGLIRWGLTTLLAANEHLRKNDPLAPRWKETLDRLAPLPVDPATGLMIGAGVPFLESHRHFSHMLLFYPLHVLSPDDATVRPLLDQSLDHWQSMPAAFRGYSYTGASAMCSWLRHKERAVELLDQFLDKFVKPNTMYTEAGPVIETPLSAAASIHEVVLQSWSEDIFGTHIRVFPAVPDAWADVSFRDMRAEGAFLVSASRRGGTTRFVRITSLEGAPCRVETSLTGPVEARGSRKFTLTTEKDRVGRDVTVIDLKKGETILLVPANAPTTVALEPVAAQPGRTNLWGVPTAAA